MQLGFWPVDMNPVDVIICWLVHYHLDAYFWILKENICR